MVRKQFLGANLGVFLTYLAMPTNHFNSSTNGPPPKQKNTSTFKSSPTLQQNPSFPSETSAISALTGFHTTVVGGSTSTTMSDGKTQVITSGGTTLVNFISAQTTVSGNFSPQVEPSFPEDANHHRNIQVAKQ